jgi:hypothetical protein
VVETSVATTSFQPTVQIQVVADNSKTASVKKIARGMQIQVIAETKGENVHGKLS